MKYQYSVSYQFHIPGTNGGFGMINAFRDQPITGQRDLQDMAKEIGKHIARQGGFAGHQADGINIVVLNWRRFEEEDKVAPALLEAMYAMGKAGARYDHNHPLRKAWEAGRKALGLEEDEAWQ